MNKENCRTFEDYINIYGDGHLPGLVVKGDGTFSVSYGDFRDIKGVWSLHPHNKEMVMLASSDGIVIECHRANLATE